MDDDLISRQKAIDILDAYQVMVENGEENPYAWARLRMSELPSAQPEIIRCKDCKYQDENWRRVSVRWLPCMDVRTGSNWYCGSAERGDRSEQ